MRVNVASNENIPMIHPTTETPYMKFLFRKFTAACFVLSLGCTGQVLTFKESSFSFGDIDNIEPVNHLVEFNNTGDKELVIDQVKAACGCTSSQLEKKNYQPNEAGSVTVTFNPAGRSGMQQKSLTFISNDVASKTKTVSFTANVVPVWEVKPERLEFNYDPQGNAYDKPAQTLTVRNQGKNPLKVNAVMSDKPELVLSTPAKTELAPGEQVEVIASIAPEFHPDNYVGTRINTTVEINGKTTSRSTHVTIRPKQAAQAANQPVQAPSTPQPAPTPVAAPPPAAPAQ